MDRENSRPDKSKYRKVKCSAARITSLAVDERIAKLVQIMLDLGLDLDGASVSDEYKTFNLEFYDEMGLSRFYDLVATGGERDDLTVRAAGVLDDYEKCWHIHVAPLAPRDDKEGWCMLFTVEVPMADYEILVTRLSAAASEPDPGEADA